MVDVAKWLTHRIVAPALVGSSPIIHPILYKPHQEWIPDVFVFTMIASDYTLRDRMRPILLH
jgi:hypothetical protein